MTVRDKTNTLHTRGRFCTSKLYFTLFYLYFILFYLVASFLLSVLFISLTPQIYYYTIIVFIVTQRLIYSAKEEQRVF